MTIELAPLLNYQRPLGVHELADRAGLAVYPCPYLRATLTVRACNDNRERVKSEIAARVDLAESSVEACHGCPGVVALAHGKQRKGASAQSELVTAVEAAVMLGWSVASNGSMRLHEAGIEPVSTEAWKTPYGSGRRHLYARADIEREIARRAAAKVRREQMAHEPSEQRKAKAQARADAVVRTGAEALAVIGIVPRGSGSTHESDGSAATMKARIA